ncbi:YolD-like family protein [Brevibacillus nitrificans]|uniref:YolD-like family protein n=1 Tax=Brevibacillus nitrificans TaxID=651560 RepID=UPI0028666125|nr:YolD-like family protein [Brevibacillus nitrificans]MDR7318938.1 hypothetical protein [Brevibacillus nitrificans]
MATKIENPFIISFILPEHAKALNEHYFESTLTTQTTLDDQEMEEINRAILESIHKNLAITVTWFKPLRGSLGENEQEWGWVQRIDTHRKQIKLVNDEGFWWIDMEKIVSVKGDDFFG